MPRYFGTQDWLLPKEAFHLKKHLKKAALISSGRFLLDPAIFTPVNMDCLHCSLVHEAGCCEGGQPYSMIQEAQKRLERHAPNIIQQYLDEEQKGEASRAGFMEHSSLTGFAPSIKACKGNCLFFVKSKNEAFCSIHRYAEETRLDPLHLKPFSCSLFPLDIIEIDNQILITALTEETSSFSRWGEEYDQFLCVDKRKREEASISPELFPLDGYRAAWEWNEQLLRDAFGDELIQFIRDLSI